MSDLTDGNHAAGSGDVGGQRKPRSRVMVIGLIAAALVLVAGGGAWFLMGSGFGGGSEDASATEIAEPHFFDLPLITVNLNNGGAEPEFLRLSIALEVRDPAAMAMIEPRLPRVLDTFQIYLRELRRADLEGSAGVYRLKEELLRRINIAVYPASVDNVLFKEIIVQ